MGEKVVTMWNGKVPDEGSVIPLLRPARQWVTVRCPECGKVLCEATPGSTVKKLCDRCKEERVVSIAA